MNYRTQYFAIAWAFVAAIGLAGCTGETKEAPKAEGEHHEGDGHDHGHEHGHATEGPHHGHLIELGNDEYHAELTHDDATKTITIYLLGKDAVTPVAIADAELALNLVSAGKPLQVKLAAAPQASDPPARLHGSSWLTKPRSKRSKPQKPPGV